MSCTHERSLTIGELAAGRLAPDAAAELLDHVEGCPACSEELDQVAALVDLAERRGAGALRRTPARGRRVRFLPILAAAAALVLLFAWWQHRAQLGGGARHLAELALLDPPAAASSVLRGGEELGLADEWKHAMELYAKGEHDAASDRLAAIAEELPDHPLVLLYLGLARMASGERAVAEEVLARCSAIADGLVRERALWYLGNLALAREDEAAARAAFGRLVELAGDYEPNARERLAELDAVRRR